MNTQTLKLLVTIITPLVLGAVLGFYTHKVCTKLPQPSIVPYALGNSQVAKPSIVTNTQIVTKVIPGKPGECPTVETSAIGGTTIAPPKETAHVDVAISRPYSVGLSAIPRLGLPQTYRLEGGMHVFNSPVAITVGTSLSNNNVAVPDVGLRVDF